MAQRRAAQGYRLLGDFVLPPTAWSEYYAPMQQRLDRLGAKYAGDADAEAVLRQCAEEIASYQNYAAYYGYAFLVMQRADDLSA